jgi:hypothetical protein
VIGTPGALTPLVLNRLLLASLVSLVSAAASFTGCVPCDSEVTQHGLAPRPIYDVQIDACITKHSCLTLCRSVFELDSSISIESCKITLVDAANAHVVVRYHDDTCSSDDSDSVIAGDDGTYDDGGYTDDGDYGDDGSTDDGSTDDGSTDDGSTDTGDTGDDGGGDTGDGGGGDSGGDDGGYRVRPHENVKSLTTPNPRQ